MNVKVHTMVLPHRNINRDAEAVFALEAETEAEAEAEAEAVPW